MKEINVEELVDSFTFDEYGAVTAVMNWLNGKSDFNCRRALEELNQALLKRAEEFRDGDEA